MLISPNLKKAIHFWADKFSHAITSFLSSNRFKATGDTISSIKPEVVQETDSKVRIRFRGKSNKGRSIPDIIDGGQPPKGSLYPYRAIEQWIKDKGIKVRDGKGKFVPMTNRNVKRAAFNIARSIREKGSIKRFTYRGSDMYNEITNQYLHQFREDISKAFAEDIKITVNNRGNAN